MPNDLIVSKADNRHGVVRYARPARARDCARALGLVSSSSSDHYAAESLVVELRALICDLEVPPPEAFGIDRKAWEEKIPLMADQALASGSPGNNPVVPDAEQIQAIYKEIYA